MSTHKLPTLPSATVAQLSPMRLLASANEQSWVSPTGRMRWTKKVSQSSRNLKLPLTISIKMERLHECCADKHHCGQSLSISRQEIFENRHYIQTVAQVVTICAVQDFALRGHREGRIIDDDGEVIDQDFNCGNRNRGNFLEIFGSYSVHDTIVRKKLYGPQNAKYTSCGKLRWWPIIYKAKKLTQQGLSI